MNVIEFLSKVLACFSFISNWLKALSAFKLSLIVLISSLVMGLLTTLIGKDRSFSKFLKHSLVWSLINLISLTVLWNPQILEPGFWNLLLTNLSSTLSAIDFSIPLGIFAFIAFGITVFFIYKLEKIILIGKESFKKTQNDLKYQNMLKRRGSNMWPIKVSSYNPVFLRSNG
jgi:hypothetical protein